MNSMLNSATLSLSNAAIRQINKNVISANYLTVGLIAMTDSAESLEVSCIR